MHNFCALPYSDHVTQAPQHAARAVGRVEVNQVLCWRTAPNFNANSRYDVLLFPFSAFTTTADYCSIWEHRKGNISWSKQFARPDYTPDSRGSPT